MDLPCWIPYFSYLGHRHAIHCFHYLFQEERLIGESTTTEVSANPLPRTKEGYILLGVSEYFQEIPCAVLQCVPEHIQSLTTKSWEQSVSFTNNI